MNEIWNLDPIYKGFDDPAFEADMAALRQCVTDYNAFAATGETVNPHSCAIAATRPAQLS